MLPAAEVVASLPCYSEENVNAQRGEGVFEKSTSALKKLNAVGYGTKLPLNLVRPDAQVAGAQRQAALPLGRNARAARRLGHSNWRSLPRLHSRLRQ